MIKVVCNTSPIIGLASIGQLHLLWELFDVYIPEEVYQEVIFKSSRNGFGKKELEIAVRDGKIRRYEIKDSAFVEKAYGRLHKGELEVIVSAKELKINVVIIDEKSARNLAETLMLKPLGLLGVIKLAKSKDKILKAKPYLDQLRKRRFRISKQLYNDLLAELNER